MTMKEKINILIVDDLPENLLVTEAIIEKPEYRLVKANSGEEAIEHLLKEEFALILLDVQMPGMDGFMTAKIIKAREKTKHIPILFITANNMESEHIFMGYSVGAIDYILKPVDPLILKAKVEGFVEIYKMKQRLIMKKNKLEKANHELTELTRKLTISETLANVISETSKDTMLVIDNEGTIIKTNPTSITQLQSAEEELLGSNIRRLFLEEKSKAFIENILKKVENNGYLAGMESRKELIITKSDGSTFISDVNIGIQFIQGNMIIAVTIRDITQEKNSEAQIKHMAYHNILTDLPNRRAITERLPHYITEAKNTNQTFGLLYLDIDRFKYINDSLGQSTGDRILQEIASKLSRYLRPDDFLSHLGSDEFAVVLPETTREAALEVAETIILAFQEPLIVNNYELLITTSMGLSMYPYDSETIDELIRHAYIALHKAKEAGKNNFHIYHTGMNMQTYRSFMMQNDFHKAIERNEFELHYQPRINVATGKIRSAEALLRWNHPNWGNVSPMEFIPLAEDTGQINKIGEWVFQRACEQIKDWDEKGLPPIRIAINFSANEFLQRDLVDRLKEVITETGIAAERLEIEITESMLMQNEEKTIENLEKISDLGIIISMDDFGTGYSSLQYLNRLPINIIKIDKVFMKDVASETSVNHSITKMIINLAKALDISLVAEGVETAEQYEFLGKYDCEEVQGYLFSPPVEVFAFEEMVIEASYKAFKTEDNTVDYEENDKGLDEFIFSALEEIKNLRGLSQRETEVFQEIIAGLTNREISEKLYISEHTVKNHISHIFQKLSVTDRSQAMAMVYRYVVKN
ncbi:EAL domain-containing protein [Oceanobacillus sp. CAU 1775]